jgi:signal transduction histidine kinase
VTSSTSSIFEIVGLFLIAALVAWPAIRRRLPQRAAPADENTHARFVPKEDVPVEEETTVPLDESFGGMNAAGQDGDAVYDDEPEEEQRQKAFEAPLRKGVPTLPGIGRRDAAATAHGEPKAPRVEPPPTTNNGVEPALQKKESPSVLLAETREKVRTAMLLKLARSGYRVFPVTSGQEALDLFSRERTDVVLLNFEIVKEAGPKLVRRIRSLAPFVPIIVPGVNGSGVETLGLKQELDVTLIPAAGDDPELVAEMIECALAAAKCIERVRADQDVRGRVLSELCFNLRSSLEVIQGYTEILRDEPDLSRFKEMLERMSASTSTASAQVQTYVDLSFLETPPEEIRRDRVDLTALEEKLERLVSRQIGSHPLHLTTSGPLDGGVLYTDGDRLLAILAHIVTDAVRFTPTGEINIAVKAHQERTDFIVSDSGPGISDVPMPFTHVEPPATMMGNGSSEQGVSLAIAERLSRSIGASLTGACGEGGAASFTLSIPSRLMGGAAPPVSASTVH